MAAKMLINVARGAEFVVRKTTFERLEFLNVAVS